MIRFLIVVFAIFLAAAGFAWLAERPGDLVLNWQGYEIRTSLLAAAVALGAVVLVLTIVGAVLRAILRAPKTVSQAMGARRRDRGYRALSRGMVAIGAGDPRAARRAAHESRTLLGENPLVLLLAAQTAQIGGDRDAARKSFERLSDNPDTRVLGLHGLFVEARRQGEHSAALHFAEEAHELSADIPWAGLALFDYRSRGRDYAGALDVLARNLSAGIVEKDKARRLRAVLLTGRAQVLEAGSPDDALAAVTEANKLEPGLVPAAVLAARLLSRRNDMRRATRLLEAAWKLEPHPDLATAYADVRLGDSLIDRLKRVQKLAGLRAGNPEGAIAVAHAAVAAHDWATARDALARLVAAEPSERVCLLMADIEEGESDDLGRVRMWLNRAVYAPRDPAWTADGEVYDTWAPVAPVSGEVDGMVWRVVPAQTPPPRAVEHVEREDEAAGGETVEAEALPAPTSPPPAPQESSEAEDVEIVPDEADDQPEPPAAPKAKPEATTEVVTPPPPDDPGPPPPKNGADPRKRF